MFALLLRRSLFLVLITAVLQLEAIALPYKELVLDVFVILNILVLSRTIGGVSWRLILSFFSNRRLQRNIVGMTTNWLFSRGFIGVLAALFLTISLIDRLESIPFFPQLIHLGQQTEVYRNAGLLLAFIGFFLDSPYTFAWLRKLEFTPSRLIFFSYGVATIVGSLMLILPWSLQEGKNLSLLDSIFTSVSALAVTGLVTVNVAETFSLFGQSIILVLIQLGGLGILALSVAFVFLARKKLSIHHSLMGSELYNTNQIGGLQSHLGRLTTTTLIIELLGAAYIYLNLPSGIENRFFHALFHSVSAFCNAGFSTFPTNLELPGLFAFKAGIAFLVILGGLGFPVFFELLSFIKPQKRFRKLSGHTWMVTIVSGSLLVLGTVIIFAIEFSHGSQISSNAGAIIGESFFYAVSSRTAGFNLTPVDSLSFASQVLIAMLMVIGGSPMSTAGGIKTTTLGVIVASAWSSIKGYQWTQFRKSTIAHQTVQRALALVIIYFSLLVFAVVVLSATEQARVWDIVFESVSALSTVGLSMGLTESLSGAGKMVIIFLMLAGRVGLVSIAYLSLGKASGQAFKYAKERYYVG